MKPLYLALPAVLVEAPPPGRTRTHPFGRKAALLAVAMLTIMAAATIAPSLPAIQERFAGPANATLMTRLLVTLPGLFVAICAPFAGMAADRLGRRRLLLGAVLLYGLAGLSGLWLDSLPAMLVGRALLGVAVAGTMTAATALIGDYFDDAERGRFMGLQSTFVGIGGVVFLTGGGLLSELHWRAPFAIYGLALLFLPAIWLFLQEPSRAVRTSGGGASAERAPWGLIVLLLTLATTNSVLFYMLPTQLPFHLQAMGEVAPSRAGLALAAVNVTGALAGLAFGRIRARLGAAPIFAGGFGLMAAGYGLIALADGYGLVVTGVLVAGLGLGVVMPNLGTTLLGAAPAAVRGRVSGLLTSGIFLGQFLSPIVSQPLIDRIDFVGTFRTFGLVLAVLALGAGLVTLRRRSAG